MPDYRRYRLPGATYFFTVNLLQRYPNDLLVRHIDILRTLVRSVRQKRLLVIPLDWAGDIETGLGELD